MCKRNCRIFFFGRGKCAAWSAAALGPGGPLKKPGRAAVAGPGLLWLIAVLEPSQSMVPQAGQPWLSAVGAAVVVVEFPQKDLAAMTACAAHHETWTRCTHGIVVWNGDHNVACAVLGSSGLALDVRGLALLLFPMAALESLGRSGLEAAMARNGCSIAKKCTNLLWHGMALYLA